MNPVRNLCLEFAVQLADGWLDRLHILDRKRIHEERNVDQRSPGGRMSHRDR